MRISVCLQFTKYSLVFVWYVVTANKFRKGVFSWIIKKSFDLSYACFLFIFLFYWVLMTFFVCILFNDFMSVVSFYIPENFWTPEVFWYFQGVRKRSVVWNGLSCKTSLKVWTVITFCFRIIVSWRIIWVCLTILRDWRLKG